MNCVTELGGPGETGSLELGGEDATISRVQRNVGHYGPCSATSHGVAFAAPGDAEWEWIITMSVDCSIGAHVQVFSVVGGLIAQPIKEFYDPFDKKIEWSATVTTLPNIDEGEFCVFVNWHTASGSHKTGRCDPLLNPHLEGRV